MADWDTVASNDNSIAALLHQSLGTCHRYVGKGGWEHLDAATGEWVPDPQQRILRRAMMAEGSKVMERVMHWSQFEDLDSQMRCQILTQVSLKLKTTNCMSSIIREAREFFVDT